MSHTSFRQSAGFSFALLSAVICSCQSALNSDLVENLIHQEFQQNMPVALTSIECPEGMTSQNGVTYLCTGFAHGVKIDFEIHPSDRPNVFDWQIATMAFEGKTVEKVLEIALEGSYLIPISKVSLIDGKSMPTPLPLGYLKAEGRSLILTDVFIILTSSASSLAAITTKFGKVDK